jgi:tetratricopeptide (TPR) repeat protein
MLQSGGRGGKNLVRARLELAIVLLGVLLLGLVPYPRAHTAALRQAEIHRAAREYGAALAAYEQAIHLDPDAPLPWLRAGEVLLQQHRFERAATAFKEAGRRHSAFAALLGLGESYAGQGDWTAAMDAWARARSLVPGDPRPYVALGQGSIAQDSFDQAAQLLDRALALHPAEQDAATAHALLGRLLIDDPDRAAGHLRQAGDADMLAVLDAAEAEADPARRALLLGAAFLQRGELTLARRELERAVALAPADAEVHAYLGHVLDLLGHTGAGRETLEHALTLNPESPLVYYFLGLHEEQVGNLAGAQESLWQALLRDPEDAAMRVSMAETFVALVDYPSAEEWYQAAVEVAPDDVEFHLVLAHFYVDHLYRIEQSGIPAAEAAVDLARGDARTHDLLGWAYYLAGRPTEARQSLDQALALDPDLVSAHYHLGSLYATLGEVDLARQHLQRAADLDIGGYYRQRAEGVLRDLK